MASEQRSAQDARADAHMPRAWQALLNAGQELAAVQDTLFLEQEQRLERLAARSQTAPNARMGAAIAEVDMALARASDIVERLQAQRARVDAAPADADTAVDAGASDPKQAADGAEHTRETAATLRLAREEHDRAWAHADAQARALRDELAADKVHLVLRDVCAQAHALMDSLEQALRQYAHGASEPEARAALESKKTFYVPACERVLGAVQRSASAAGAPRDAPAHLEALERRWDELRARMERPSAPLPRARRTPRTSDPASLSPSLPRPQSAVQRRQSMVHLRAQRRISGAPGIASPRTPSGRAPAAGPRSFSTARVARRTSGPFAADDALGTPSKLPAPRPGSAAGAARPGSALGEHGMYYRPPSARSSRTGDRLRRRESMLPRLSTAAEEEAPTPSRSPAARRARQSLGPRPSFGAPRGDEDLAQAFAGLNTGGSTPLRSSSGSGRPNRSPSRIAHAPPLPGSAQTHRLYMPDTRDALDVGVARVCNARGVRVERLDAAHGASARDQYKRYRILDKTLSCRLLAAHRPEEPQGVDVRHVHVRVGGGWEELQRWLDARVAYTG